MPQMSPLLWFFLPLFFSFGLIFLNMMLFYIFSFNYISGYSLFFSSPVWMW